MHRTSDRRRCVPPVLNERFEKDSNGMPQYDPAAAHERRMARAAARRRAQQRRRKRRLRLLILCLLALVLLAVVLLWVFGSNRLVLTAVHPQLASRAAWRRSAMKRSLPSPSLSS